MEPFSCAVCRTAGRLRPLPAFAALPRVTSDCKPWPAGGELTVCTACGTVQKPPTDRWLEEIGRIYGDYEIYHLSQGAEQVIFAADGSAAPRSRTLAAHIVNRRRLPETGRLLDIGCGNGGALISFAAALPGWRLNGHELSDRSLSRLQTIPGFEALHNGEVRDIPGGFDLISAIHSLEHMPDPGKALADACRRLNDDGTLFLQVPDVENSPFDLLVADHRTHFTRAALERLTASVGLTTLEMTNQVLPKEITFIGRFDGEKASEGRERPDPDPTEGVRVAEIALSWLEATMAAARTTARDAAVFSVFGSSVSGIWLYGALADRIAFFVDEDPTRIGRTFDGKPILAPDQVPAEATVFIPLIAPTAARVAERLADKPGRYVRPPAMAGA